MQALKSFLIIAVFFPFHLFSQSQEYSDSLVQIFEKTSNRKHKFQIALELTDAYSSNFEAGLAEKYLNEASELIDHSDNYERAQLILTEGLVLINSDQLELAEEQIMQSLDLSRQMNSEELIIENYAMLASLYSMQSKVYLSNSYWFSCIPYFQTTQDIDGLQTAYNSIGFNYTLYDEYEHSLEYFQKAFELADGMNDLNGMSAAKINIGYSYEMLGDKVSALEEYRHSLTLHEKLGIEEYVAYSYVLMGTMFAEMTELDSAQYYLDLSNEILGNSGDSYGLSYVHFGYAKLYEQSDELNKSLVHAQKALELSAESEFTTNEMKSLELIQLLHKKKKNYQEAYEVYVDYIELRDSIKNPLNSREIAGLEYKYEYQKSHLSDSLKFEEDKRLSSLQHEEELKRFWIYAVAGIVFVFFLIALLVVLIRNARIRRKKNHELQHKNKEIELQKRNIEIAHYELEEKNEEILDSINYAKRIQSAILPPTKTVKKYLKNSFILYKPKDIVAGDFYWLEHKGESILFAAADCTGHGVPGAMVSVICNNGLNRSVRELGLTDPGKILDKTRELVVNEFEKSEEDVQDGMDIALCVLKGNLLQYAGAHNPLWIIRKGSSEIEEIKADKQPIGKFRHSEPFATRTLILNPGDTLYIFSDGYADQFGGDKGKKFKTSNFKKLLLSIQNEPLEKQKELLDQEFENWKGTLEQLDDVCVIGVRV